MRQCRRCPSLYSDATDTCAIDGSSLRDPDPLLGSIIDGKYRVDHLLGTGGMGAVYRAEQILLGRPVAIKVLRLRKDGDLDERFRREAMAVARLKHPSIVTCYDFGVTPAVGAYLVLEYVDGQSLRERLDRCRRLEVEEAVDIALQVGLALDEAHAKGVVHRDLKPENIFLESGDARAAVKVLDFGIAKIIESSRTPSERITSDDFVVGTPAYMSPEQCEGSELDGRSDIYSLGCVLYEMLTGRPPFAGASSTLVFARHQSESPRPPRTILPDLVESVERVVLRSLAKRPSDRYASGTEFAVELQVALAMPMGDIRSNATETSAPVEPARRAAVPERSSLQVSFPTPRTTGHGSDAGLPPFHTRFVGRETEIAEVIDRLSKARLVTLSGIGGIGKTRLAVEAAARVSDNFVDGIAIVAIETVTSRDLVTERVAAALGVREQTGRSLADSLARSIGAGRMLIVLDNCEHLAAECASLVRSLLRACPRLQVLATSQVVLGVSSEAVYRVPPMQLPGGRRRGALDSIRASEAGRLFLDRVEAARPDFTLSSANASKIAELIRRLDGIPLAIELAAARARLLTIDEICARLDERFHLLAGPSAAVRSRHPSLEATLEWSFALLPEEERILARRLGVFLGGFSAEMAAAVTTGDGLAAADVAALIERLVDKSLVCSDRTDAGPSRYRMLDTIREFSYRKLTASGEAGRYQTAHADYFLHEVELARRHFYGPGEREWVHHLEVDIENLRMALEWTQLDECQPMLGLRLAAALGRFWEVRGHWIEGRKWLEGVLRNCDAVSPTLHGEVLYWLGVLALHQGSFEWARAFFRGALELLREVHDEAGTSRVLRQLALAMRYLGDSERAEVHLGETLASAERAGDRYGAAQSLKSLAMLAADRNDLSLAISRLEEALDIARSIGDQVTVGLTLQLVGELALRSGDAARSEQLLAESLAVGREHGSHDIVADSSAALARLAAERGDIREAARWYLEALAIYRRLGNKRGTAVVLEGTCVVLARSGNHAGAVSVAAAADAARRSINFVATDGERETLGASSIQLRAALGDEVFDGVWQRGLATTIEEAAREARRYLAGLIESRGTAARSEGA